MKKTKLTLVLLGSLLGFSAFAQENSNLLERYFNRHRATVLGTDPGSSFQIYNTDRSASLKGDVVKFVQTVNQIPVYQAEGTALISDNQIRYINHSFLALPSSSEGLSKTGKLNDAQIFSKIEESGVTLPTAGGRKVSRKTVYFSVGGTLKLAHEISFYEPKTDNYWHFIVNADSGEILQKENLTLSCSFHDEAYGHTDHSDHAHTNETPYPDQFAKAALVPDAASYRVFEFPKENPNAGGRTLVTNPWIIQSSPEGWHFDGTTHYTTTRGNNVFAYDDVFDLDEPGSSADGGAGRVFDFPLDLAQHPSLSLNAVITNLFYANNRIHDIFYKFGFTETARNFQSTNFGLGGADDDYVLAEAQDGGGMNNANFATPPDGGNPAMQMYLWGPYNVRRLFYNTPADAVPRTPSTQPAEFGLQLNSIGITGDAALANPLEACTPLPAGSLTNKIGIVQRGTCSFSDKVKNAQNAGAKAVIVYNAPNSTNFVEMGGTDGSITIPSILVLNGEGEYIKNKINSGVTVNLTVKRDMILDKYNDGSLDNGIVIHEYGHGISNRLTGNGYTCLSSFSSREQMGEGWSDFFALMLTNRPGDNAGISRGVGAYAVNQSVTGQGIRPAKYSPNFSVNDYTYADINSMQYTNSFGNVVPNVHSIGFVWSTILWDLHWKYVEKYGYASDVTSNPASGSARVLQLVMDGMKLQECNPTFVSGRDAILQAELATTQGADRCMIWEAFANRGVGVNASAGLKQVLNDAVQDNTMPSDCFLATNETGNVSSVSVYPNPARHEFFIGFPSNTIGKVKVEVYDASGKLVMSEDKVTPKAKTSFSTDMLTNGVYVVKVKGLGIETSSKLIVKK